VVDCCPIDFHKRCILKNLVWQVRPTAGLDEAKAKTNGAVFSAQGDKRINVKDFASLPKFSLCDNSGAVILPVR
jgi:hypothetical protein